MKDIIEIPVEQFKHFKDRCKYLYYIRSEDNKLINYKPNSAQRYLEQVRQEEFTRSEKIKGARQCKIMLLKSRQVGGTTDTALYNLDKMLNLNMAYGLILAHNMDSTPILYKKYQIAFNELPKKIFLTDDNGEVVDVLKIKPQTEAFSNGRLEFGDFEDGQKSTESRLLVRTAGAGSNVGRGDTLNLFHGSECAFYDHFDEVFNAVNQSLPNNSFVYSVLESTANGVSGSGEGFYNLWQTSMKEWKAFKNGVSPTFEGYRPVFIPWYKMSKYRKPLVQGQLINIDNINWHTPENEQKHLQMEEKIIEEIFDDKQTGLEAVNWYRWCMKENCKHDILMTWQEYPTTPEQAFISTDNCFFNTSELFVVKENFSKGGEREYEKGHITEDYSFEKGNYGELVIWEHPKEGWKNRYVVGLDPAEGRGGDYTCIMVFDRYTEKFVAKWYGDLKEDLIAEEVLKIAYYYNEALIVPERNLSTVLTLIRPYGIMPYTGEIYYQTLKTKGPEYGYYTSTDKKDLMMKYNAWLRENYDQIPDKSSLEEHITFVKEVSRGTPKYRASEGNHDDQVIAMALCIEGHDWWRKEIYHDENDKSDIKIVTKSNKKPKPKKISRLGSTKSYNGVGKTKKQSELGQKT